MIDSIDGIVCLSAGLPTVARSYWCLSPNDEALALTLFSEVKKVLLQDVAGDRY